ncbi:MAG TPA: hypothetical protein VN518_04630 [Methyloceanibacter sp.]|jgi:hypothetical protein|nr:hypothetical protein [Methyloceanibacter sp.]
MTTRLLALAFVLFAVSPCYAGEDPGRYTMTTVGDSVWRLDSATGAMSVCGQKLDHWACESVADDALALKAEADRLARENRELKDKLAKAEEREAEAGPLPANPSTQFPGLALGEMNDFINKMIRSLQDLVRDLKRQEAGQEL